MPETLDSIKRILTAAPTDDAAASVAAEIERCQRLAKKAEDLGQLVVSKQCSDSIGRLQNQLLKLMEHSAQFCPVNKAGQVCAAFGVLVVEAMERAGLPDAVVNAIVDDIADSYARILRERTGG